MFADDARAYELKDSGLTGLGVVFHVGWHLVWSMFQCCLPLLLSFKCKSESDGASSTRKVDDPLFLFGLPDLAILEIRGGKEGENEQPNNARRQPSREGVGGSVFVFIEGG